MIPRSGTWKHWKKAAIAATAAAAAIATATSTIWESVNNDNQRKKEKQQLFIAVWVVHMTFLTFFVCFCADEGWWW